MSVDNKTNLKQINRTKHRCRKFDELLVKKIKKKKKLAATLLQNGGHFLKEETG